MSAAVPSDDVARFYCTKHSWRGKYVIFIRVEKFPDSPILMHCREYLSFSEVLMFAMLLVFHVHIYFYTLQVS